MTITQKLVKLKRKLLTIVMKYINTPEFNDFAAEIFHIRLK